MNSKTTSEAWGTWGAPTEEAATTTTEETTSAKGLKATGSLAISGGTFVLTPPMMHSIPMIRSKSQAAISRLLPGMMVSMPITP